MKIILTIGLAIVFISVFFIFFSLDKLFLKNMECQGQLDLKECRIINIPNFYIFVAITVCFLIVDAFVVYLMLSSILMMGRLGAGLSATLLRRA